jgi:hypothetical protein
MDRPLERRENMAPPKIIDDKFPDANKGLKVPTRLLASGAAQLRMTNLDRADPPAYVTGSYIRSEAYNANAYKISAGAKMPPIRVECSVNGVDLAAAKIIWRLQIRYIAGRYAKANHDDDQPQYNSFLRSFDDVWTGASSSSTFTLFDAADKNVSYDNLDDRVAGGNSILTVAIQLQDGSWLQDYVHLRVTGTNPAEADVRETLSKAMAARQPSILNMINAAFAHENNYEQFEPCRSCQTHFSGFTEPKSPVLFQWPCDPANFPSIAFDFGIGISQFTHWGQETMPVCWDWRSNVANGVNELLGDLRRVFRPRITWLSWASRAWSAYNGDQTGKYVARVLKNSDGQAIAQLDQTVVPDIDLSKELALLPLSQPSEPPRAWPVPEAADPAVPMV